MPHASRDPLTSMEFLHRHFHRAWPVLFRCAGLYRRSLVRRTRLVAVVGSFGKSTTTRFVAAALGCRLEALSQRNSGSFLARSLFRVRPGQPHAVIEVGIHAGGQMARYAGMLRPDAVVVTSIGSEHHRSLGTLADAAAEKAAMVRALPATGAAYLNGDDSHVLWMAGQTRARVTTFGLSDTNTVRASNVRSDGADGTRLLLHASDETREVRTRLLGQHMVYPVLAAVAVALGEGLPMDRILSAVRDVPPTPGRLQPVRLPSGALLLRDDYKGAEETFHAALDALASVPARRRLVVLGEVEEPKGDAGPLYRRIGERVGQVADRAYFVCSSRVARLYSSSARQAALPGFSCTRVIGGPGRVVAELAAELGPGDVVLVKGRGTQRLARIALALSGQTVGCELELCSTKATICEHCPALG
ncbi:MAG: hypothetical protein IH608_01665, partial [Proteobacteria bacterium]|nr:hypothetical protein [Pseudomonadota bacterium]